MSLAGYRRILVWVGCPVAAERACELAAGIAGPGVDVTIGWPASHEDTSAVARLARPLADREVDVRIVALADRGVRTLAAAARERRHDLVIHADVERPCTLPAAELQEVCGCPVWSVRVPDSSPDPGSSPKPSSPSDQADYEDAA